jgi:hypothetical protein
MRGLMGCSARRWWVSGRCSLAGRRWTEVAAGVSRRGSVWSTENRGWDGIGCGGEKGCSWALYIGWGRLSEAAEERSRWRPMEFNGVVVSRLESAPRGRGNGGAAPLWKGSGGGMARDVEVALSATTAGQTGGGGAASDRRRETKEEQVEWAAKGGWAGFRNGRRKRK